MHSNSILIFAPEDPYFIAIFSGFVKVLKQERANVSIVISPIYGIRFDLGPWSNTLAFLKRLLSYHRDQLLLRKRLLRLFSHYGLNLNSSDILVLGYLDWLAPMLRCLSFCTGFSKRRAGCYIDHTAHINVDDLIVDTFLRFKPSYQFLSDDHFAKHLSKDAKRRAYYSKMLISTYNISHVLSSYSTYTYHGIALRLAQSLGIGVITFGGTSRFYETFSDESFITHRGCHWTYPKNILISQDVYSKAETSLKNRLMGKKDITTSYMKNFSNSTCIADSVHNERVIFLHDFYDSPHIYRWMLHQDFYHWITDTLNTLVSSKCKVFIKPHPNQSDLSKRVVNELKNKYSKFRLVQWISETVLNQEIFNQEPCLAISVYGSVLVESAYCGIKCLSAGDHPAIDFSLSANPSSIEEYHDLLRSPEKIQWPQKDDAIRFLSQHSFSCEDEAVSLIQHLGISFDELMSNNSILLSRAAKDHILNNSRRLINTEFI